MSCYIFIRRLRGPAILLLIGTLALLHQMGIVPYFGRLLWPLLLILLGVLLLAERFALEAEGYPPPYGAPWTGAWQGASQGMYPRAPDQGAEQNTANPASGAGTAIVPTRWQEFEKGKEGGRS
ncbi:MAG: LiaI-LiaF-like domain-containing protein [Terracidiphilus sp.]